jgi:hypothetical protein
MASDVRKTANTMNSKQNQTYESLSPSLSLRHGLSNQSFLEDITVHMPNHKHDHTFFPTGKRHMNELSALPHSLSNF